VNFLGNFSISVVDLRSIKQLVIGQNTEVFKKQRIEATSATSFSVLYAENSLDFVCEDIETFNAFVSVIHYFCIEKQRF
jgi:hypothetical protein